MLKMIDIPEALHIVFESTSPLSPETTNLSHCPGLILAEDIFSNRDFPPFDRALMDGMAVCLSDAGKTISSLGELPAGSDEEFQVRPGYGVDIMTGAPCPPGTEAVVKIEDIKKDGRTALLPNHIEPDQYLTRQGREVEKESQLLKRGEFISPLLISVMASLGKHSIKVIPQPSLSLITTGNELTKIDAEPGNHQIRDSNGPMLTAMAKANGVSRINIFHATDSVPSLLETLELAGQSDILLITGGVSAGKYDLVPQALAEFKAQSLFHKVWQKPGKPLFFAVRNHQLIFGLPGTPLGSLCCFHRYVSSAIRKMGGKPFPHQVHSGILTQSYRIQSDRPLSLLARVKQTQTHWEIDPLPGLSSSDFFASRTANTCLHLDMKTRQLSKGQSMDFEFLQGFSKEGG